MQKSFIILKVLSYTSSHVNTNSVPLFYNETTEVVTAN